MQKKSYNITVIGAGIAGITACHALARAGASNIALIDCGPPLALTSDKSTECYRNFWPGPDDAMAALMDDSINRLHTLSDVSGNRFQMQQHGYAFATTRQQELESLADQALENERYGGGALRHHSHAQASPDYQFSPVNGFDRTLDGADLITNPDLIRQQFPYFADDTAGVLHVRNCGSLSAQQLGMYLFEEARNAGTDFITAEFNGIQTSGGTLSAVEIRTAEGVTELKTDALVLASGPHLKSTAQLAGTTLPVQVEKHVKMTMPDKLGVIPRHAPLIVWNDPVKLHWTAEEQDTLADSAQTRHLIDTFPAGVHGRPVGAGNQIFIYWTFDNEISDSPVYPIEPDPWYPEILLRGMARMVPGLTSYLDPMPRPFVDGGYYTKTADNRPLIGPLDVPGTFVCGAYSGYGIMASCAGGDLLATHVLGHKRPHYAKSFECARFNDPTYIDRMAGLTASGQI